MKYVLSIIVAVVVAVGLASNVSAAVTTLGTEGTVDDLFVDTPAAVGSILVTDFVTANFDVDVYSQAYSDGNEYAYLYQIDNDGSSSDPIELFTLSPFTGADGSVEMGYLTGSVPSGFLSGVDQIPESTGNVNSSGPIISFYYTSRAGFAIDPGQQSFVMYVMSDLAPDIILGSIINGTTDTQEVIGPIPEPATFVVLILGGLFSLLARRRLEQRPDY